MEPRIRARLNPNILTEVADRYQIEADTLVRLASAESFIYAFDQDEQPYILRLAHSLRRSVDLIQGEVDWINYLARGGASVARAVLSGNGQLVECIDDGEGGHFLATAFVKAPGRPPTNEDNTPEFVEEYGRVIGLMHRLTQGYAPANAAWQRPQWDSDIEPLADFLPESEAYAREQLLALIDSLQALPKEPGAYGLVHQDAHGGNFFVDDSGTLTFFDFDDCAYTWFVNDIAIVLFYNVLSKEDPSAFAAYFLEHFLRGYGRENRFDPAWFSHIPSFLKLRELDLYAVIHRSTDVNNLTDPWDMRYMAGRKERIENDVPFLDFDFTSLRWS